MYKKTNLILIILILSFFLFPLKNAFSGNIVTTTWHSSDTSADALRPLVAFFDLRNRESFVQITNVSNEDTVLHIQIFNVDQDLMKTIFLTPIHQMTLIFII